jgi:hypothetical protein
MTSVPVAAALTAGVLGVTGVLCAAGGCGGTGDDAPVAWKRGHQRGGRKPTPSASAPAAKPGGAASAAAASAVSADQVASAAADPAAASARWEQLKQDGTAFYKNDEPAKAIEMWQAAAEELVALAGDNGEQLAALYSNCALARNKQREQLEEDSPAAASRLLPLMVLDCNRALSESPNVTVRCKALKHRAEALATINDEVGLLHAVCDLATAKKEAGEQANAKGKKSPRAAKARWKKNEGEYDKQKTSVFTKLLAKRLTVWKQRQDQRQVMFDAGCQLCGTATEAPQGTEQQNAPLRKEVYEFPRPVLLSVREQLEAFRPARTLEELQEGSWSIDWTATAKSTEAMALQVFKRFQEAAVLTKSGAYGSALPIWETAVRTGKSEYEAMADDNMGNSGLAVKVAICASDAAFYCGVLYYAQGQKTPRMKARRTKDAMEAHTCGLGLLDKLSDNVEATELPEFKRSKCANLTARGTMMVVDDMRELISRTDADTGKASLVSGAEAHAAARKNLEAAQKLQDWHPDLQLSLARMELEPVTRTQVAMAAAAQQGQQPNPADMDTEQLQAAVNRAEAYMEKTLEHAKPTLQAYTTAGQHRLSGDAGAFETLMVRAEEDYPDHALLGCFRGKMYHTLATIAKKKSEQLAQVVPIVTANQIPKDQLPQLLLQLGVAEGQTLESALALADQDSATFSSKAPNVLEVAAELFEKENGGHHPAYVEAQLFRHQMLAEKKGAGVEAKQAELQQKILAVDPADKNALILQFKTLSEQSEGDTPAANAAQQQLLRQTAKLLLITDTMGEAQVFGQKLINLEVAVQVRSVISPFVLLDTAAVVTAHTRAYVHAYVPFLLTSILTCLCTRWYHLQLKERRAKNSEGSGVWLSSEQLLQLAAEPKNAAFLFLKPHAATDAAKALLESELSKRGLTVTKQGELSGETIDKKKLIDKHYYSIASKATLIAPANLPGMETHAPKFEEKFGLSWAAALEAGQVYNAEGACTQLKVDAAGLDTMWAAAKKAGKLVKFGGGFYCAELEAGCYVLNGFFMAMRSKYTTPRYAVPTHSEQPRLLSLLTLRPFPFPCTVLCRAVL